MDDVITPQDHKLYVDYVSLGSVPTLLPHEDIVITFAEVVRENLLVVGFVPEVDGKSWACCEILSPDEPDPIDYGWRLSDAKI